MLLISVIFFGINIMLVDYRNLVFDEFFKYVFFGISAMIIASYEFDAKFVSRYWFRISIFFFILMHLLLGAVSQREFNYMHFGFITNFVFVGFMFQYYKRRKVIYLIALLYIMILSFMFGHRGAVLVNLVIFVYFCYKIKLLKPMYIIFISSIGAILYLFTSFRDNVLLNVLYRLQTKLPDSINSYVLKKLIFSLESENLDLSGREEHYSYGVEIIREKLYFFPSGFGYFDHVTNLGFPHNIFIDIYIVFGVFGALFLLYLFIKMRKILLRLNDLESLVIFSLFLYSFVRLMTGGTFIMEPSFWVIVGIVINESFKRSYYKSNTDELKVLSNKSAL
ncbi:hypothetical protein D5F11_011780 [Siminovitchia terrae]|uniref:O-antigen polymerase n=1 Tax=Siminovitchia terrae TaxID=1914933 RepID=A0A429X7Z1_SIMTE|nr:hypothetical protein [Siminovitchia terrae]RST59502.1 hypothetical protein D5F11_011780 [Siminovitchia terrae]